MTKENELILSSEQQEEIMRALLLGLESFGEIERIEDEVEIYESIHGANKLPKEIRPIHPTGAIGTLKIFAAALRNIQQV